MTAAFWWYVLAGFIVGFCLSTVWEWLYFRQRRMRITDRRITELEQALRSQSRTAVVEVLPEPGVTWSATGYASPGVLLENEADNASAPRAAAPAVATAAAVRASHSNGSGREKQRADPAPPWAQRSATAVTDDSQWDELTAAAAGAAAGAAVAAAAQEPDSTGDAAPPATTPAASAEDDHRGELAAAALAGGALVAAAGEKPSATPPAASAAAPAAIAGSAPGAPTTEVRGLSARPGYIVSELSPGEFTALQAAHKARQAARKAWEQARAVTDYLRNI